MDKAQALRDSLTRSASYRPLAVRLALVNAARAEQRAYEAEPYGGITRDACQHGTPKCHAAHWMSPEVECD